MKISTRDMILVSLFTGLTAMGAFLSIPLGPIPLSLQSIFVILSGIILGPKLAALSQIVYILLGLAGLRIFAGFKGGPQMILSPTFGFLLGFILAAYLVGRILHNYKRLNFKNILLSSILGSLSIYLIGLPYMYLILTQVAKNPLTLYQAFKTGCLIFLPGDLLKALVSSFLGLSIVNKLKLAKLK